jgi:Fic-DOC domain mobile mystery protein B
MGLDISYIEGQTPLDEDDKEGLLIPSIATRGELDDFEQRNIELAVDWTLRKKRSAEELYTEGFVRDLHAKMFSEIWRWAGQFRLTNKNIGVDKLQIGIELRKLFDDARYWTEHSTYSADELAVRFSHRIVFIHCFRNGNGRHSRLIADVVVSNVFGLPVFTWSRSNLNVKGDARIRYLQAIREADAGNIKPLVAFARS